MNYKAFIGLFVIMIATGCAKKTISNTGHIYFNKYYYNKEFVTLQPLVIKAFKQNDSFEPYYLTTVESYRNSPSLHEKINNNQFPISVGGVYIIDKLPVGSRVKVLGIKTSSNFIAGDSHSVVFQVIARNGEKLNLKSSQFIYTDSLRPYKDEFDFPKYVWMHNTKILKQVD